MPGSPSASAYHNYVMAPHRLVLPFTRQPIGDVLSGQSVRRLAAMIREVARTRQPQIETFPCESDVWVVDVKPRRGSRVACETTWILASRGRWQATQEALREALDARQPPTSEVAPRATPAAERSASRRSASKKPKSAAARNRIVPFLPAAAKPAPAARQRVVTLRLSPEEHAQLRGEAHACQLSLRKSLHALVLETGRALLPPAAKAR